MATALFWTKTWKSKTIGSSRRPASDLLTLWRYRNGCIIIIIISIISGGLMAKRIDSDFSHHWRRRFRDYRYSAALHMVTGAYLGACQRYQQPQCDF